MLAVSTIEVPLRAYHPSGAATPPLVRTCVVTMVSAESQASPVPSASASAWPGLATVGQLSVASGTESLSSSESQASPVPSASASAWPGLATVGQLSVASGTESLSVSVLDTQSAVTV